MNGKNKRLRRQARLARNKVLDEHRDRMNALFYREAEGEDIWKDCSISQSADGIGDCLVCQEDRRFESEWRLMERAVNWNW